MFNTLPFVREAVCYIASITDNNKMDKVLIKKLAKNIKRYRKLNQLTQDDLAFLANLPRSTIGNIETASNDIVLSKINKIAKAFNIKLSELLNF